MNNSPARNSSIPRNKRARGGRVANPKCRAKKRLPDRLSPLSRLEYRIVWLRYFEGLTNQEAADTLVLRLHQVKYRVKKPNVKEFINSVVVPHFRSERIKELENKLANPIRSFVEDLAAETEAKTYRWIGPAKKVWYSDTAGCNRRQMRALIRIMRIYGITEVRNINPRIQKWLLTYIMKFRSELTNLRAEQSSIPADHSVANQVMPYVLRLMCDKKFPRIIKSSVPN